MGSLLPKLYKAFTEKDMSMLEINPLVITKDQKLLCLDAKIDALTARGASAKKEEASA